MKYIIKMMPNGMPGIIPDSSIYYWDVIYRTFEASSFREVMSEVPEIMKYKEQGMIRVLYIEPLKEPALTVCSPDAGSLRSLLGDRPRRVISPDLGNAVIHYGENAKSTNLMLNRGVKCNGITYDILSGPIVITGSVDGSSVAELDEPSLIKAYEYFERPELFYYDKDHVRSVKCSQKAASVMRENNISIIS